MLLTSWFFVGFFLEGQDQSKVWRPVSSVYCLYVAPENHHFVWYSPESIQFLLLWNHSAVLLWGRSTVLLWDCSTVLLWWGVEIPRSGIECDASFRNHLHLIPGFFHLWNSHRAPRGKCYKRSIPYLRVRGLFHL